MLLIKPILAFRPNRLDWIFASKTFLAGIVALYIAFALNLAYPIWAIGTVFVIANPYSGLNISKSVYRVLGTLIGALVAIVVTPLLIHTPWLFTLFLALWVGVCLYLSLLDRSPRSYAAMLAGYTTVIICYNIVYFIDSVSIFDMALGRFLEISIGVVCSAVITSVIWPISIGPIIEKRIQKTLHDSHSVLKTILLQDKHDDYSQLFNALTRDTADLHQMASHLAFENSKLKGMTKPIQEMLHQLSMAVANLVAMSERIEDLKQTTSLQLDFMPLYQILSKALEQTEHAIEYTLEVYLAEFDKILINRSEQQQRLLISISMDGRHFLSNMQAVQRLWKNIQQGKHDIPTDIAPVTTHYPSLHRDHGVALRAAVAAMLTVIVATGFWILSGWKAGFMLAEMAVISSCILATMDNPVPALKMFIRGNIYAAGIIFIYAYGIFPFISEFWQLALVMAPFCMYCLMLILHPPLTGIALPLLMGTIMGLNLKNSYQLDQIFFFDASIGTVMGPIVAAYIIYLVRAMSPEISAQRILKAHDHAMLDSLNYCYGADFRIHLRAMLDRIALVQTKVVQSPVLKQQIHLSLIEASATINFVRLHELQQQNIDHGLGDALKHLQLQLQDYFRQRTHTQADQNTINALNQEIDNILADIRETLPKEVRETAYIALNNIQNSILQRAQMSWSKHG